MKKLSTVLAAAVMGMTSLPSAAQGCIATTSNPQLSGSQIFTLVNGKLVCGRPGANYPGGPSSPDRWQEEHQVGTTSGGQLWDYKLGPGPSVDPRKQVGNWAVPATKTNPNSIAHSYTGNPTPFVWSVYGPPPPAAAGSVYSFCLGAAEHVRAYVITSATGCSGNYPP